MTEEDVKRVIINGARKTEQDVQIRMRENRNGNQNAMVILDRDTARDILRVGTLKIG